MWQHAAGGRPPTPPEKGGRVREPLRRDGGPEQELIGQAVTTGITGAHCAMRLTRAFRFFSFN